MFCILAVDFTPFPRELAKTETFGMSLMDLGVGAVIFSMGLTSDRFWQQPNYLGKAVRSSLVTLGIGMGRLAAIKLTNYHEHESEYGRHWNFFLTLALVPILVAVAKGFTSRFLLLALLLESVKSLLNRKYALEEYIMSSADRVGLLQLNREGVYSTLGYFSIYLVSSYIGRGINRFKVPAQWRRFATRLVSVALVSTLLGALSWYSSSMEYAPSRRCANTPYVLWTVAICSWQLLFLFWLEWHYGHFAVKNDLLDLISRHQLALFLIANVLTGLINIKFQTLLMNTLQTHIVLTAYLLLLCFLAKTLDKFSL